MGRIANNHIAHGTLHHVVVFHVGGYIHVAAKGGCQRAVHDFQSEQVGMGQVGSNGGVNVFGVHQRVESNLPFQQRIIAVYQSLAATERL